MFESDTRPRPTPISEGCVETTFAWEFDHELQVVWRFLTEPELLAQWLAPGTIDLRVDGSVKLDFGDSGVVIDSRVTAYEPGRLLAYSWSGPGESDRPVIWALDSVAGGGARLSLTLRVPATEDVARACAGWEAHLDMLSAALEGVPIKFPFRAFQAYRAEYGDLLTGQIGEDQGQRRTAGD